MLCPYCKEEIKDEAIKCKHCKSSIGVSSDNTEDNVVKFIADTTKIKMWAFLGAIAGVILFIYAINSARFDFIFGAVFVLVISSFFLYSIGLNNDSGVFISNTEIKMHFPYLITSMMCLDIDEIESISDGVPLYIETDLSKIRDEQIKEETALHKFIESTLLLFYMNEFLDADNNRIIIKQKFFSAEQINDMRKVIIERMLTIKKSL